VGRSLLANAPLVTRNGSVIENVLLDSLHELFVLVCAIVVLFNDLD